MVLQLTVSAVQQNAIPNTYRSDILRQSRQRILVVPFPSLVSVLERTDRSRVVVLGRIVPRVDHTVLSELSVRFRLGPLLHAAVSAYSACYAAHCRTIIVHGVIVGVGD
jgi:hypothetical protein